MLARVVRFFIGCGSICARIRVRLCTVRVWTLAIMFVMNHVCLFLLFTSVRVCLAQDCVCDLAWPSRLILTVMSVVEGCYPACSQLK